MEYKTIIDGNGNIVDLCIKFINGLAQDFTIEEGHRAVERYIENFIKPFWNGTQWIENATDEEIKAWNEKNKEVQKPTEQQILNAQLLQQNANLQLEIEQQKQLNSQILLQLAGGNTNV